MCIRDSKSGEPRIRRRCTLPLTAARVVRRIYTNLALIDVTPEGLLVREIVADMDLQKLQALTEAHLILAPDCGRLAQMCIRDRFKR